MILLLSCLVYMPIAFAIIVRKPTPILHSVFDRAAPTSQKLSLAGPVERNAPYHLAPDQKKGASQAANGLAIVGGALMLIGAVGFLAYQIGKAESDQSSIAPILGIGSLIAFVVGVVIFFSGLMTSTISRATTAQRSVPK